MAAFLLYDRASLSVLKTLALIFVLALGPNASLVCPANCDANVIGSAGCHESATGSTLVTGTHCVEAPAIVAAATDAGPRMTPPARDATGRSSAADLAGAASQQTPLWTHPIATNTHCLPLPLRI